MVRGEQGFKVIKYITVSFRNSFRRKARKTVHGAPMTNLQNYISQVKVLCKHCQSIVSRDDVWKSCLMGCASAVRVFFSRIDWWGVKWYTTVSRRTVCPSWTAWTLPQKLCSPTLEWCPCCCSFWQKDWPSRLGIKYHFGCCYLILVGVWFDVLFDIMFIHFFVCPFLFG